MRDWIRRLKERVYTYKVEGIESEDDGEEWIETVEDNVLDD